MGNEQDNKNNQNIKSRLLLENTRVLFDFMQELSNRFTNLSEPITNDWEYQGYKGIESLAGREKKLGELIKLVNILIVQDYDENGELLSQNSLSSFLNFYNEVFGDPRREFDKIAEMLNYFNILRFLTEPEYKEKRHKDFDAFPYIFEDLCLSIRNMTDANSAYLVYKKEGEPSQLISRSGYVIKESEEGYPIDDKEDKFSSLHIGATEFDLLIKCFETKQEISLQVENEKQLAFEEFNGTSDEIFIEKINDIINGIVGISIDNNIGDKEPNRKFLLIDFPFDDSNRTEDGEKNKKGEEKRHFYVIFELKDQTDDEQLIKKAIRILFLRNRLHEAVKKYYAGVLNFRFYCNYIQSFADQARGNENINILHLTDLHLNDDEIWSKRNNSSRLLEALKIHLKEIQEKKPIDLIAVTGDIINFFSDASTAQRKYKRAANLFFEIVKGLWGKEYSNDIIILPHDWKRRILITTGNHDYVTMGDVRVQTESRKITTALPAKATGGTMSKYTYYLEFLSYFLDAPTQKLLNSDLNEVREYEKFNLIIGIFNSCAQANALQTNKVSFDSEKVELALKRGNWTNSTKRHIALAHHYPSCPINYFDDKYEWWKFRKINNYCDLKECYVLYILALGKCLSEEYILAEYLSKEKMIKKSEVLLLEELRKIEGLSEACKKIADRQIFCAVGEFIKVFSKFRAEVEMRSEKDFLESELFKDMVMLQCLLEEKKRYADEYVFKFLSDASSLFKTMARDKYNFENAWKAIKGNSELSVFAGHTHKANKNPNSEENDGFNLFVGHKFYERNKCTLAKEKDCNQIVFEIITVKEKNAQRDTRLVIDGCWQTESAKEACRKSKLNLK